MLKSESKLDMTFAKFFEIYEEDKKKGKGKHMGVQSHVIRTKILPYFFGSVRLRRLSRRM